MNGCNGVDGQFHGGAKEHVLPVRVGPGGGGVLGRTVMSRRCAQTTNVDVNDGWLECCNSLGHFIERFKWNIRATSTVVDPGNVVLVRGGPSFGDVLGQRGMLSQIPLRSTRPGWHRVQLEITFQSYSPLGFIKGHDNVCYREWDCDDLRGTFKGEDHDCDIIYKNKNDFYLFQHSPDLPDVLGCF